MDHYLLILINICVEQWAGAPWQIILLTEMTLIGCSEFLPRRFIFADNEMVMNRPFAARGHVPRYALATLNWRASSPANTNCISLLSVTRVSS